VLVGGHDVGVWTDAVHGLLDDAERRAELGRRAIEHASAFGWEETTDRLLAVYRQAIHDRTHSPIEEGQGLAGVPRAVIP
jgi:D-inositol-3-phosphate glycosyltransferase